MVPGTSQVQWPGLSSSTCINQNTKWDSSEAAQISTGIDPPPFMLEAVLVEVQTMETLGSLHWHRDFTESL